MNKLAIFSPNQNAYSETFIQAHRKLPFNILFYFGDALPRNLENHKSLYDFSIISKIKLRLNREFNLAEHALIFSLQSQKVDCVLAEYGTTAVAVLNVLAHLKIPLIVHFHGSDASLHQVIEENRQSYKRVFNYAKTIIVVSEKMKTDILALGCPEHKLRLCYYGPDNNFFNCKPDFASQQFISVGRFIEKKAPYLTILAFKKIVVEYPSAKLIMVGEGELLSVCKQLADALGINSQVEFKEIQTVKQIQSLFNSSVTFVQHSIVARNGDAEGTPVAVLEAQASSLPVISTRHAGIPDVVVDGTTGLLVNEKDVEGMAGNMRRMLAENGLAKQMGEAGRKRVAEHFSMEKHLKTLEDAVNDAVKKAAI